MILIGIFLKYSQTDLFLKFLFGTSLQCCLSDLYVLLGLMSLYSYLLLPSYVLLVSVVRFVPSGLCMFVGNYYMGFGTLLLLYLL